MDIQKSTINNFLSLMAVVGCAMVWLLTVSAPFFASIGWMRLSFLNYFVFHIVCHQLPERSFWVFGYPMAVCARCSGIYTGILGGTLLCSLSHKVHQWFENRLTRTALGVCFAPIVVDVALHQVVVLPDWSLVRAATGFLAGCALSCFVCVRLLAVPRVPSGVLPTGCEPHH